MSPTDPQRRTSDNTNYHHHHDRAQHHHCEPASQPKHYYLLHYLDKILKAAAILMLFTYVAIRSQQSFWNISTTSSSRSAITTLHQRRQLEETALPSVNNLSGDSWDSIYL